MDRIIMYVLLVLLLALLIATFIRIATLTRQVRAEEKRAERLVNKEQQLIFDLKSLLSPELQAVVLTKHATTDSCGFYTPGIFSIRYSHLTDLANYKRTQWDKSYEKDLSLISCEAPKTATPNRRK